ncbi:MAG: carbon starvation protein A [Gemmataceae bacterium]|nr:carbon starvation protein A [Gemmataceae bacterium]
MHLLAVTLWHHDPATGRFVLHALPVMLAVLCCLAVAYRYYSAFLAAKVAALDGSRVTPAARLNDGQNYVPTNKWVLFGHHFAAISGAGPLIGPVLAIQYGYLPGLLWLVIGVCLAGAVQDMLVLAASVRSDGKSLAEIARRELGGPAAVIASAAILFIVVIALAGLGIVVVKALGGEEAKLPAGMQIAIPAGGRAEQAIGEHAKDLSDYVALFPPGCRVRYTADQPEVVRSEAFRVRFPKARWDEVKFEDGGAPHPTDGLEFHTFARGGDRITLPAGSVQVIPGSSWGTFAIACTIPIALLVGLWMYRIRPGRIVEASVGGGLLTLGAVVAGNWIPGSPLEGYFSLSRDQTILALCVYGFIAAVLPVWLLLGPRDYLSSFLKIGTVALLVVSVCVANPPLHHPPLNEVFANGGPTFLGKPGVPAPIFPFVFICVMCGSISGFHSLVSSGTTPKMVESENHVRTIGYGAMLIEGLVGVTALVAAAALPPDLYYDINVPIEMTDKFQAELTEVEQKYGVNPARLPAEARDRLHAANVDGPQHLDLGKVEEQVGGESLRGRTGGAVTLAVGMSAVFAEAFRWVGVTGDWLLKYWYHFAIMFEALFILTTIDAGTRIARFLLQETAGRVYAPLGRPDWLPGAVLASALVTAGWGLLVYTGSIATVWPMFGIANQVLAVLALALVTTWLVNNGRGRYAPVTVVPMLFVMTTTLTAAYRLVNGLFAGMIEDGRVLIEKGSAEAGRKLALTGYLSAGLTVFVVSCVCVLVLWAAARWVVVWRTGAGERPAR